MALEANFPSCITHGFFIHEKRGVRHFDEVHRQGFSPTELNRIEQRRLPQRDAKVDQSRGNVLTKIY